MKTPQKTSLSILVDVVKQNYREYYKSYSGHDFLSGIIDGYDAADSVSYLMEHVRKLNKQDSLYPEYLIVLYAIYRELEAEVRIVFTENDQTYKKLITVNLTKRTTAKIALLEMSVTDESKLDEFVDLIKEDTEELFTPLVMHIIKDYKAFKSNKELKFSNLDYFYNDFTKRLEEIKK